MITQTEILQIIFGFTGGVAFSVIFNIRGKKMLASSLGAMLAWSMFILLKFLSESELIRYFIVAMLISVYSEIMARLLKTPTTTFHMSALIPLIPGASLYYTMVAAFEGDFAVFSGKALHTLKLAVAIALAIVLVSAGTKIIMNIISNIRRKRAKEEE